ncbi:MAG: SH3 domain-containing protein [Proteobacteria bacterium]|nr:SH3 domain-containing protein [Pseudomonadota bacterium]
MDKSMSVHVRQSHVREEPSFLGRILARLSYGDRVFVLNDKTDWFDVRVEGTGTRGFMHTSALSAKKVILNPGEQTVEKTATRDEFALAGKGFNESVEGRFRAENPHLNFGGIDRMEAYGVSEDQMRQFLFAGKVMPRGGTL